MTHPKERILECACDLYLAEGQSGFSMRKLARSVGVTAPALYRHFENREDLLIEVILEGYRTQVHYLHGALTGSDPQERMQRAGQGYLDFALDHPRYYGMLYAWADFMGLDDLPQKMLDQIHAVKQFWHDRVRECMNAGIIREGHCEEVSHVLWSQAHGIISLYLRGVTPMSEEGFRELYTRSFLRIWVGLASAELAPGVGAELDQLEAAGIDSPLAPFPTATSAGNR
jgi:AcrR family transcriptional regulator